MLAAAGLVRRKPRAGTVVTALPDDTRYRHSIGSLRDLMQYAQTTDFHYVYVGRIELSRAQARIVGARAGQEWIFAVALRREAGGGKPLALTRLYLNPALKASSAPCAARTRRCTPSSSATFACASIVSSR